MDWGELKVLHAQKLREALAATRRSRAIEQARPRRAGGPTVRNWLTWFWRALAKRGRVA
jgi:hypothetical protein